MAQRRMFSKKITDTDMFLDMPLSTQALYFHLNMHADDEGFMDSPKKVMRTIGASEEDFKILLAKQFIFNFDSGVCVIRDWKIHNYIRSDRFSPTIHTEEKDKINILDNGKYTNTPINVIPDDNHMDTQVRLGKDSIGKDSIDINSTQEYHLGYIVLLEYWKSKGLTNHSSTAVKNNWKKRHDKLIKDYGIDNIKKAIDNYHICLTGKKYYWSHKYTFWRFIEKCVDFLDESEPLKNYMNTTWKQAGPVWEQHDISNGSLNRRFDHETIDFGQEE